MSSMFGFSVAHAFLFTFPVVVAREDHEAVLHSRTQNEQPHDETRHSNHVLHLLDSKNERGVVNVQRRRAEIAIDDT